MADQRVLVLAGSHREVNAWRTEQGLLWREVVYGSDLRVFDALRPTRIVVLPGFQSRRAEHRRRIMAAVTHLRAKLVERVEIEEVK